jgi:hypothetical protein
MERSDTRITTPTAVAPSICSLIREIRPWTAEEHASLKNLARWSLTHWPTLYRAYVATRSPLAVRGLEIGYDWGKLQASEAIWAEMSANGKHLEAAMGLAGYLLDSIRTHMPELLEEPVVARLATELSGFRTQQSASGSPSNP